MINLRELQKSDWNQLKALFISVFTKEPWNDDWSNEMALDQYLKDLTENANSLSFGLFDGDILIGLSLGRVIHFYTGVEYRIDEFCIAKEWQRQNYGSKFLLFIEKELKAREFHAISLLTDRDVPAYHFYVKNNYLELKGNVEFYKIL